ncbi:hypothetical protein ACIO8F_26185 [Streptomyces sp. NPDC087228]|uniref:hypothetical protein n=1 Tax=Streptomyces sp. NPDC087228 TaxID=3365772 RepID=UPI0038017B8B
MTRTVFGKKSSPTVAAVKKEAKRMTGGEPTTPADNQAAAQRKALLHEVPVDIRQQGRKEATQDDAADRDHSDK